MIGNKVAGVPAGTCQRVPGNIWDSAPANIVADVGPRYHEIAVWCQVVQPNVDACCW